MSDWNSTSILKAIARGVIFGVWILVSIFLSKLLSRLFRHMLVIDILFALCLPQFLLTFILFAYFPHLLKFLRLVNPSSIGNNRVELEILCKFFNMNRDSPDNQTKKVMYEVS